MRVVRVTHCLVVPSCRAPQGEIELDSEKNRHEALANEDAEESDDDMESDDDKEGKSESKSAGRGVMGMLKRGSSMAKAKVSEAKAVASKTASAASGKAAALKKASLSRLGSSSRLQQSSTVKDVLGAAVAAGGNHDGSDEILGYPKDCGPRENVHILSYARAMHVRAENHPHLEFERTGTVWRCVSPFLKDDPPDIRECVAAERLPTAESEAKDRERRKKRRAKQLDKMGVEKGERAAKLRREFPAVDPEAPVHYIVSFPLDFDFGMHGCREHKEWCGLGVVQRALGCVDKHPLREPLGQYGVGVTLYFKFFRVMKSFFAAYAVVALLSMYVNFSGSGYSEVQKERMVETDSLTANIFLTTLGSWGEKTTQCAKKSEGTKFTMSCESGVFTSIEAYYGQPLGTCSCPVEQQLVDKNGDGVQTCPATTDYSRVSFGECPMVYGDGGSKLGANTTEGRRGFCLQGKSPFGAQCCAPTSTGPQHVPDFSDLLPRPAPGCDSAMAQYIVQQQCLGRSNCTLDVDGNRTFDWRISDVIIGGKPTPLGCGKDPADTNRNCSASFSQGNFTDCTVDKAGLSSRNLFVVGTCWTDSMKIGGAIYGKTGMAMFLAYLDAFMVAVLIYLINWIKAIELHEVDSHDDAHVTASDFTLRVLDIPSEYTDADEDELKMGLKEHFERTVVLKDHDGGADKPVKVCDINFGFDDHEVLRAKQKRGVVARALDLAMTKARLLETYGNKETSRRLRDAQVHVRSLTYQFLELNKVIRDSRARRVVTAFVTFEAEEMREAAMRLYEDWWFLTGLYQSLCLASHKLYFKKTEALRVGFTIRAQAAREPENLIWENLGLSFWNRVVRTTVSVLATFVFLSVAFALIIAAKNEQAALAADYPSIDCYPFAVNPFKTLNYTRLGMPDVLVNGTYRSRFGSDYDYTPGVYGSVLTPQAILEDQRPWDYNLTDYNSGILTCFCSALMAGTAMGCGKGEEHYKDCGVSKMVDFEFEDREGNTYTYCEDWFIQTNQVTAIQYFMVVSIIVVNMMLKKVLRIFVDLEAPESETERIVSTTQKLFVALLMNTALLSLIIQGNVQRITGGASVADELFRNVNVLQGDYGDFGADWYMGVGAAIVVTMFISVISPQVTKLISIVTVEFAQCYDRGCRTSNNYAITHKATQHDLEELYMGPSMDLIELYATFLNQFFVCMMFNAGMPALTVVFYCFLVTVSFFDKVTFFRLYRLPPAYDAAAALATTGMLQYAVTVHLLFAVWMFSNPDLFEQQSFFDLNELPGDEVLTSVGTFVPYNSTNTTNGTFMDYGGHPPSENATNATGFLRFRDVVSIVPNAALADTADTLASIQEYGAFARVIQSVQCAAYLPLLGFYITGGIILFVTKFVGRACPEFSDKFKKLQQEKMDKLRQALEEAEAKLAEAAAQVDAHTDRMNARLGDFDAAAEGGVELTGKDKDDGKNKDDRSGSMATVKPPAKELSPEEIEEAQEALAAAAERKRALTLSLQHEKDTKGESVAKNYWASLPDELLAARIHLNQLDEKVLLEYKKEEKRRAAAAAEDKSGEHEHKEEHLKIDGVETYNMSGNYKYVSKFALDSEAFMLHKKGNLKLDYKAYVQDMQDIGKAGVLAFLHRLIFSSGELQEDFPEPDAELETASRRARVDPAVAEEIDTVGWTHEVVNPNGTVAKTLGVLGVPTHKSIVGPSIVVNLPMPGDLFELVASARLNDARAGADEKQRFVQAVIPGYGKVRIAIPRGVGCAGVPELQIAIPAVDFNARGHGGCAGLACGLFSCCCPGGGGGGNGGDGRDGLEPRRRASSQGARRAPGGVELASVKSKQPSAPVKEGGTEGGELEREEVESAQRRQSALVKVESNPNMGRKELHQSSYDKQHAGIAAQEFVTFAPEEVILAPRIPVVVKHVGRLMAKWPAKAKPGAELRFHLPGVSVHFNGHFPDYSIIRPVVGEDGLVAALDDDGNLTPCGWATILPELAFRDVSEKVLKKAGVSSAVAKMAKGKQARRKSDANRALADAEAAKEAAAAEEGAAAAVAAAEDIPLGTAGHTVHLQVEAYCPAPVIKSFGDAPLWQTLGECGGRPQSFESVVPAEAAILMCRHRDDGFLGCSVRVPLRCDSSRLLHGQRVSAPVPGASLAGAAGDGHKSVNFQLFCDDVVLVPGAHGRLVGTRGYLPWPVDWANPLKGGLAPEQVVPFLDECFVDYPAVRADDASETNHAAGPRKPVRRKSGADLEADAAKASKKGSRASKACCFSASAPDMRSRKHTDKRGSTVAGLQAKLHGTGVALDVDRKRGWAVDREELDEREAGVPRVRAGLGDLKGADAPEAYDGVKVLRQEFLLVANKDCEYRHGTGKHWLSQEVRVGVPLLGHLHALFPPQCHASLTRLHFELPALDGPKPHMLNTEEERTAMAVAAKHTTKLAALCCPEKDDPGEEAYQVGWAVAGLPSWAPDAGPAANRAEHPIMVLVLPLMVPKHAFDKSVMERDAAAEVLRKACKMPHTHPSHELAEGGESSDEEGGVVSSSSDNTSEVMGALEYAISLGAKYAGRDTLISVGKPSTSLPRWEREGLLPYAKHRLDKLKHRHPEYHSAMPDGFDMSAEARLRSETATARLEEAQGGTNPLMTLFGAVEDRPVVDQPGANKPAAEAALAAGAAPMVEATGGAAGAAAPAAGAKASPSDFASFLFAAPEAKAAGPGAAKAASLLKTAKLPGAKGKGWGLVKAAHAQSLASHHAASQEALQSDQKKLRDFLVAAGLGDKHDKFLAFGVDSVKDALDEELLSDEALAEEVGLSADEIAAFREKTAAARTLSKLTGVF